MDFSSPKVGSATSAYLPEMDVEDFSWRQVRCHSSIRIGALVYLQEDVDGGAHVIEEAVKYVMES